MTFAMNPNAIVNDMKSAKLDTGGFGQGVKNEGEVGGDGLAAIDIFQAEVALEGRVGDGNL